MNESQSTPSFGGWGLEWALGAKGNNRKTYLVTSPDATEPQLRVLFTGKEETPVRIRVARLALISFLFSNCYKCLQSADKKDEDCLPDSATADIS